MSPSDDIVAKYLATRIARTADDGPLDGPEAPALGAPLLIISGQCPRSAPLDEATDLERHRDLGARLAAHPACLGLTEVRARASDGQWEELSWALRETPEAFALVVDLCHAFAQNAFFRLSDAAVEVRRTDGGQRGDLVGSRPRTSPQ